MSDYSNDDTPSFDPPVRVSDSSVIIPVAPNGSVTEHSFTVPAPGAEVKVQLVCLENQLYIWVGANGGDNTLAHGEMSMALPGRSYGTTSSAAPSVSVAALTNNKDSSTDADRASDHLAARLSKRTKSHVVASVNVSPDLRPIAEKAITEKLKELGI
tara:strand:+ start:36913 stop:37383 length:471 start_codon:yes stop_codon:yes gene_type:complete